MLRLLASLLLATGLLAAPPSFVKEGKGPGILLIHGFGGNRRVWDGVAPALARDHTVVRVDLPGSGGTEGPPLVEGAADFEAIAHDLAALVRQEGLAPCLIVGHSMGGPLAALTVLQDPAAFRGLVFVDSFLGTIPATYFDPAFIGLDQDPASAMATFFAPMVSTEDQKTRLVKEVQEIPVPALKAYLRGMSRDTLRARQSQLKLPAVQLQSGPEPSRRRKRKAQLALFGFKDLPSFRVIPFPQAHHWIMWDDPAGFLKALQAFEKDLPPTQK